MDCVIDIRFARQHIFASHRTVPMKQYRITVYPNSRSVILEIAGKDVNLPFDLSDRVLDRFTIGISGIGCFVFLPFVVIFTADNVSVIVLDLNDEDAEFVYDIPTEIGINEVTITKTRQHVYILADHTKLHFREDRSSSYGSCTYDCEYTLVTDDQADPAILEQLRLSGANIVIVPSD